MHSKVNVVHTNFLRNYILYFVWDSAPKFGAMGSTSFLGFSYPNLLLVFSELLFLGTNLYNVFLASIGTFSGSFLFFCTLSWVS